MQASLLIAVAAAGSLGAVCRHLLATVVHACWPELPLATFAVNVIGCFGFGLCLSLGSSRWSPTVQGAVLVGFFGAFTTFSSLAFDCHELWQARRIALLLSNVLGQNLLGFAALWGGIALGEGLTRA